MEQYSAMKNQFKVRLLPAAICMAVVSGSTLADLYISPVVRDTVQIQNTDSSDAGLQGSKGSGVVIGNSTIHGEFTMDSDVKSFDSVMRYGRNVPLFVALERIVPESDRWAVNIDKGLENTAVDWDGGETWEDVLNVIAKTNSLVIELNAEEKAIGISKDERLAQHLAYRVPKVWRLDSTLTVRENLDVWSARAGWSLEWDQDLKIDYPVSHSAVMTGQFAGQGGVVDQILNSIKSNSVPLTAVFYTGNNVVFVTEAGFTQEVSF